MYKYLKNNDLSKKAKNTEGVTISSIYAILKCFKPINKLFL
jgi:hypothetical protein